MTVFPATLPAPLVSGFSETLPDNTIRTAMDMGPAKLRRRTTANVGKMGVSYLLTSAQLDILIAFYQTDTGGGILPFTFTHPRTAASLSCRFTQVVSSTTSDGINYAVTIQLEILP